ncbi:MAG: tRNA (guanosine(46)-N7)-methyltransferase TrmB [Verrucomicrobiota bacterium]
MIERKIGAVTLIYPVASLVEPVPFHTLFSAAQPLEVELGSGDGSFLAQYAGRQPARNFIGVERLLGRLRKLDRKGLRAGLTNLRVLRIEASYFVEYLLPSESVSALHIYFPDPWPKRKHHKNRLINERFTRLAHRVLAPGGVIYLRTDNVEYFEWMLAAFAGSPQFQAVETPVELRGLVTDFEREFNAQGIPTRHAAYQKQG